MLFVLTGNRLLTAVELENGQPVGQILFPRKISAPVSSFKDDKLLCIGDEDVFYIINRQEWKCSEVRYHGHAKETITIQPQFIADQLLILQSDQLQNGRMQVLRFPEKDWKTLPVQTERLVGSASGSPILWGDRLFLKTDHSVISVWHLTDASGKPLLNRITNANVPFSTDIEIFMQPFEGDRLLIAGESLRELTLLTNAFEQRDLSVELGKATQSLQLYGTSLSAAGEASPEQGQVLIHYNYDLEESFWRLRLSCDPQLLLFSPGNTQAVRCLDSIGNIFDLGRRKKVSDLSYCVSTERISEATTNFSFQQKIGQTIEQNRNLVFTGQDLRLLNRSGQSVHSIHLPEIPERATASSKTIYWADKTGIHVSAWNSDAAPVSAWLSPIEKEPRKFQAWTDLIAVDEQNVLAFNDRKTLLGLQVRKDPHLHLGESGTVELESKAIGTGVYDGNLYWLALENNSGIALDPRSLVIRQQTKFDTRPSAGPWRVGSFVYVELEASRITCRDAKEFSTEKWTLPLEGSPLSIAPFPLNANQLLLCRNNGSYFVADMETGKILAKGRFPAAPSCLPLLVDQTLYVGLKSGSVASFSLDQLLSNTK